jgi:hypothetical protein
VAWLVVLAVLPKLVAAQTCSCAAVPLLGTMESASPADDQWYLSGTFEFHDISELVSGSSTVPNTTGRERTSEALILELSRGLSDTISVTALVSAVRHERRVGNEQVTGQGIGDAVALLRYSPKTISLYGRTTLSMALGVQLPVGRDDIRRQGITLAEDLQPSSGAYAGTAWLYAAYALNDARSARAYASAAFKYNRENSRDYQFGHAATVTVGGSYQTQSPWGFSLELLYRHADPDRRLSFDIPNTGGQWLDAGVAAQYHLTESLAVKASAKIPVSRDLDGELQFTTKYSLGISVAYVFGSR